MRHVGKSSVAKMAYEEIFFVFVFVFYIALASKWQDFGHHLFADHCLNSH